MGVLMVALGGALGAIGRFGVVKLFKSVVVFGIPVGVLGANWIGCFLIGVLVSLFLEMEVSLGMELFLIVGVLGGFTTFSAFSMDAVLLLRDGAVGAFLGHVVLHVVGGIVLAGLGFWVGRGF